MQLNKEDIAQIAYQRFNRTHNKRFFGIMLGWLAAIMATGLTIQALIGESIALSLAIIIPMVVGMLSSMYVFYNKPQRRYVQSMIEECEANPTLCYTPDSPKCT